MYLLLLTLDYLSKIIYQMTLDYLTYIDADVICLNNPVKQITKQSTDMKKKNLILLEE